MARVKRLVRLQNHGRVALPAEVRRIHNLKPGDLVTVEDTETGVLITPQAAEATMTSEHEPFGLTPPTPEELAVRKAAVEHILAVRARTPSIAPLTTADLVHMSRDDTFWYGEEAPDAHGTGG